MKSHCIDLVYYRKLITLWKVAFRNVPNHYSEEKNWISHHNKNNLFKLSAQDSDLADFFISRIEVSDLACTLSDNLG